MSKYVTEFIGTFFLVLTIGLAVLSGTALAPLAIGAALMVMVYMGGHVSGGHYNPAVSVAILIRGKMDAADLVPYFVSQLAGALAAAAMVHVILGKTVPVAPSGSTISALLVEILYTFALVIVVLNVATSKKTEGNSYYGLAIGFTIAAAAFAGGPVSGGAFNPAVGIGTVVMHGLLGDGSYGHVWLYVVGPLIGGVAAAGIFRLQEQDD